MQNYRGIVYDRCKSISDFAEKAGWKISKARRIVNGEQEPDIDDICKMVDVLHISEHEFVPVFFEPLSTKWTKTNNPTTQSAS